MSIEKTERVLASAVPANCWLDCACAVQGALGGGLKRFYCEMSVIHNIFNGHKLLLAKVNKNGVSGLLRQDILHVVFGSHCAWK